MSVLTSLVLKLGAFNKLNASSFIFSHLFLGTRCEHF